MKPMLAAFAAVLLLADTGQAAPWLPPRPGVATHLIPIVVMASDSRQTIEDFARQQRLSASRLHHRHAASGIVRCGDAIGSAQLVGNQRTIVTASHVLFDEQGQPRGLGGDCSITLSGNGASETIAIDVSTARAGARTPYKTAALNDWAVARLMHPARTPPYRIANVDPMKGAIHLVATSRYNGQPRAMIEACHLRGITNKARGMREVALDCSAGAGASGGAILTRDGHLAGIYIGDRSAWGAMPVPFSRTHYNFGVLIEGPLRRAIEAMGGP